MLIIWNGPAIVVVLLAAVVGFLAAVISVLVGLSPLKSVSIAFMATGAALFYFSRRERDKGNPNSIFFIPVWFLGIALAGFGLYTFFIPMEEWKKAAENKHLDSIRDALNRAPAGGGNALASTRAKSYRTELIGRARKLGLGDAISVYVEVDGTDARTVKTAHLYAKVKDLKKYGDGGKRGLAAFALDLLAKDFPKADLRFAARGNFLWGVRGEVKSGAGAPAILVDSDSPDFPELKAAPEKPAPEPAPKKPAPAEEPK